jgi:hypothetical protein
MKNETENMINKMFINNQKNIIKSEEEEKQLKRLERFITKNGYETTVSALQKIINLLVSSETQEEKDAIYKLFDMMLDDPNNSEDADNSYGNRNEKLDEELDDKSKGQPPQSLQDNLTSDS